MCYSSGVPTGLWRPVYAILLVLLTAVSASAQSAARVWFASAGADGNGTSAASPIGSTVELERRTGEGDIIMLLPSAEVFDGGLALKAGQALIGLPEGGRKPVITNTGTERHGGSGIVLARDSRVWNVRVARTRASGIFGFNTPGVHIDDVEVDSANGSASLSTVSIRATGGPIAHAGILLIASGPDGSAVSRILRSEVTDATGIGIAVVALGAAHGRLLVADTRVENGAPVGRLDVGIAALAEGPSSHVDLDLQDSNVRGRLSPVGRNVVLLASADASARGRIERSHIGESGQDGVIAIAALTPSELDLEIRSSVVERAAQTNIEGTILNLPPSDSSRAHQARLSMLIVDSTIRDAGTVPGFENDELGIGNVWMGPSVLVPADFPRGSYHLTIRDSRLDGAKGFGLGIGNLASRFGLPPDGSRFEVLLRGNELAANGSAEIMISAPDAHIDARQNCWGVPGGLSEGRIDLRDAAQPSQVVATEPLPCGVSAPR